MLGEGTWKALVVRGLLLSGCATLPAGPSVMALPGTGKPFEQFQTDDLVCRQWASQQTGTTAERASGLSTAEGAGLGTSSAPASALPLAPPPGMLASEPPSERVAGC